MGQECAFRKNVILRSIDFSISVMYSNLEEPNETNSSFEKMDTAIPLALDGGLR